MITAALAGNKFTGVPLSPQSEQPVPYAKTANEKKAATKALAKRRAKSKVGRKAKQRNRK